MQGQEGIECTVEDLWYLDILVMMEEQSLALQT